MHNDPLRHDTASSRLVKVSQATIELNCSLRSLRRLLSAGEFQTVRIGRSVRITRESIDSFIQRGGTPK
jgi:excisionase family DNA binding protein